MIILEDVTKTYSSGVPALNGINLHVQKGEFVFIVGKSGSGKSTLIKLLLKELDPTTGKIYVNKKYLNKITRKKLPYLRRDIGVVFQDFRLLPDRNVFENIAYLFVPFLMEESCMCWSFDDQILRKMLGSLNQIW